ncbi:keratin, type I cytoskeletal 9-like [Solenopsis invicta]|uniref:keratin, type I cytoskeletal 9-like n=1 Tax=Solenopsis invicta TaxID=13686 RepID=UPI00193D1475|nr:keratin, type I cytoskeletal 9-like [Solenopsis invicta]
MAFNDWRGLGAKNKRGGSGGSSSRYSTLGTGEGGGGPSSRSWDPKIGGSKGASSSSSRSRNPGLGDLRRNPSSPKSGTSFGGGDREIGESGKILYTNVVLSGRRPPNWGRTQRETNNSAKRIAGAMENGWQIPNMPALTIALSSQPKLRVR